MSLKNKDRTSKSPVIDMSKNASQDRFYLPKANLIRNKSGSTSALGLHSQPRPCLRPLTSSFEQGKHSPQPLYSQEPTDQVLKSPRHQPYVNYLASIKDKDSKWGSESVTANSIARCRNTKYASRVASSNSMSEHMTWTIPASRPTAPSSSVHQRTTITHHMSKPSTKDSRPYTAPQETSPMSWNLGAQEPCMVTSPRFLARSDSDARKSAEALLASDREHQKQQGRLNFHAKKKVEELVKEAQTADAMKEWPHGLPVVKLTKAKQNNLAVGGVGYGTPQSIPDAQYRALKSGMKWP